MSEKDFKFHIPIELIKADDGAEDSWQVKGIASTGDEDLQGEIVDQNGLDISMLKAGQGWFNFDHQKGPENVLGKIDDAEFITQDGKKALIVKGYLFKHVEKAKAFYGIMKSLRKTDKPRVHMSIEGKIIQRDMMNSKTIKKARINKVALTLDPVNPYTYAELIKSLNTDEITKSEEPVVEAPKEEMVEISKAQLEMLVDVAQKALAAGIGYASAPTSRTGGAAMTTESLEKEPKTVTYDNKRKKDKKKLDKSMVKSLIDSLRKAHPQEDPLKLAEWVIETFLDKVEKD